MGLGAGRGHCVVFLGKTLYSNSASLQPRVSMGTGELSGKPDKNVGGEGGYLRWTSTPSSNDTPGRFML